MKKPLQKGIVIKKNDAPLQLAIKYEKLPDLCYKCGMLTHMETSENFFEPWLRACFGGCERDIRLGDASTPRESACGTSS